ncbi:amino acid ABC transporter permease [Klugiella xanthotipulae]|uniref:Amino acid ABC transporter membrane protein (PAAT family) n=1 Tax=Klugiella xanthotipulae TaxID=244735 RepID=A0A543I4G1_9MICO|nr:amino acid ABC transporter permease [Klugiella xanthotipulae]TQM65441.1 amino acid ABC transporter membrane protein (PAAT family) [Klugiella xanthotipulae]
MALTAAKRARLSRNIQYLILVAVVVLVASLANWGQIGHAFFNFGFVVEDSTFLPRLVQAFGNTLLYTALGFILGLAGGVFLALLKLSSVAPYRWISTLYIEVFRGLPALLVFIAFGYGIPTAFPGLRLDTYVTVMLALGLVSAAYIAETIRAGLQAVPAGQMEAARSLGMSHSRAMVTIVIPQALRIVLPPLTNEVILLTKDSSLIYLLGLTASQYELSKFGREALNGTDAGLTPLVVAGVCYLIITVPLSLLSRRFETKTARIKK